MDPINFKPQVTEPKIINLDGSMFEDAPPEAIDDQSHRQLFAFDDPTVIKNATPSAVLLFSESLLKQSISDAINIARQNGMDLNTISRDKTKILIQTSLSVLKQRLEEPNQAITNIKPYEIVKASTDDKATDRTETLPFNEFVLSLNGALGISKSKGTDLENLNLRNAIKILNNTASIIEKKLKSRTKIQYEPIASPANSIQRAKLGLSEDKRTED